MRIAFVFHEFRPPHFSSFSSLINLMGIEVIAIELDSDILYTTVHNGTVLKLTATPNGINGKLGKSGPNFIGRIQKTLDKIDPEVLIIGGYNSGPLRQAARWAKKNQRICILTVATHKLDRPRYSFKERIKGWWIRSHFDAVFVGGKRSMAYLEELGFDRHRIWCGYDVVDNIFFNEQANIIRLKQETWRRALSLPGKYFLYVGRLAPEKNLEKLLLSFKEYLKTMEGKGWDLVIVGSGPLENELKVLVMEQAINGVHWLGHQSIEDLPKFYALASCLILPSLSEPWGMVVNEAMASGLPTLASNHCGSVADLLLPGKNGFLFDPLVINDISRAMAQISSLMPGDLEEMGVESLRIISVYTPEKWTETIINIINSCKNPKKKFQKKVEIKAVT